jgi:hypothetical protein
MDRGPAEVLDLVRLACRNNLGQATELLNLADRYGVHQGVELLERHVAGKAADQAYWRRP